jgi:hypothetical protein
VSILVAFISSFSILVANYINNKSNENRIKIQAELDRNKEREKIRLAKCEEIYLNLVKWQKFIFSLHMDWISLMDGHATLEELDKKESKNCDVNALQASLGVYFPNLKHDFKACQVKLQPANKVYFDIREGKKFDRVRTRNIILESGTNFDNAVDELLLKLSAVADFK